MKQITSSRTHSSLLTIVGILIGCVLWTSTFAQTSPPISAQKLKEHVKYLASEELQGRGSGTEGNMKAARYIAAEFDTYGLKPAGDNGTYFQEFEFVANVKVGSRNSLAIQKSSAPPIVYEVNTTFRPLGFSSNATVTGPVVFAGYGISAPDRAYDDYKEVSVKDKVVIVLRYGPDGNDPHSEFSRFTSLRNKARTARDKGASALILVTGPADDEEDDLVKLSYDQSFASSGLPSISMKRSVLAELVRGMGRDLGAIQDSIRSSRLPIGFDIPGVEISLSTDVDKIWSKTSNVLGYIPGNHPELKDEVLILGAHFDHLGWGGPGSGSLVPDTHAIHHGADDNASGTASLLELARVFAGERRLQRSLLFIGFSGEELGTLGSGHYVQNPLLPLEKTIAMLNMDMVGRLDENKLTVGGTGTSTMWDEVLTRYGDGLEIRKVQDGFGPSDHARFYGKDIPVLFFFTGTHPDYHKPSDTWEKINYGGQERITRLVHAIAEELVGRDLRPAFTRAASTSPMGGGSEAREFRVTLGVIPDYGDGSEGMKVGGLRPDGPAERAGIRAGDVIVMMAGKKILNIYDYMGVLGDLKPGDTVEIEIMRDGKPTVVTAVMTRR
jgi:aminopeptidase YwaD